MFGLVVKTLFICVFVNYYAEATTEEEMKEQLVNILIECSMEFPPTADEIELLKQKKLGTGENVKCMFACAYKKSGMMNDKGELSVEGVNEISKKYFSNNPEKMQKAIEFADACKSVNDEPVSDGTKGCERATLIFKCSVEKAAEFNFTE